MKKNIIRVLILAISVVVLIVAFVSMPSFYENDTTVMLSQGSISFFNLGEVAELSAAVVKNGVEVDLAEDGEKIVWSSSDYGVATVDNGVVMSVGYGSCVIWARYGEYSAFCTVSNPNPNPMFTISETELFLDNISSTKALHLITDVGENISSAANWRSSNDNVASCRDGVITATGYGSCIVTATYNRVLSVVQLEQIRTIDKQRVIRYFGRIDRSMMKKVEEGMLISLGIKGFDRRGECIGTNHDNRNRRAGE